MCAQGSAFASDRQEHVHPIVHVAVVVVVFFVRERNAGGVSFFAKRRMPKWMR